MAFDISVTHWRTITEFADALATVKRPAWCTGITHHNTYIPNEDQWRGMASMFSMRDTYIKKGWTSGPNLYLCAKAPNPADTGIWQMTPITRPGTHAGACNAHKLGIENVGDFDRAPPSADQYTLLITVTLLLLQHWGLPPESVNVHNECMTGRTCPGKHLTGNQIRATLNSKPPKPTNPPPPPPAPTIVLWQIVAPCVPLTGRSGDAPLADTDALAPGDVVQGEATAIGGWRWISDKATTRPGIGFVPASYTRPI